MVVPMCAMTVLAGVDMPIRAMRILIVCLSVAVFACAGCTTASRTTISRDPVSALPRERRAVPVVPAGPVELPSGLIFRAAVPASRGIPIG